MSIPHFYEHACLHFNGQVLYWTWICEKTNFRLRRVVVHLYNSLSLVTKVRCPNLGHLIAKGFNRMMVLILYIYLLIGTRREYERSKNLWVPQLTISAKSPWTVPLLHNVKWDVRFMLVDFQSILKLQLTIVSNGIIFVCKSLDLEFYSLQRSQSRFIVEDSLEWYT